METSVLSEEFLMRLQNPLYWMNREMIKQMEDLSKTEWRQLNRKMECL
jgi:hypothetical protein